MWYNKIKEDIIIDELSIKEIEDTPLSEGKTLTELKQEVEERKEIYETSKKLQIIGYATAGVVMLAGAVGASLTQNADIGLYSLLGAGISSFLSAGFGKYTVSDNAWEYEKSYEAYYEAIKKAGMSGEIEETKERSRW